MREVEAVLRLIRPINCTLMGIAVLAGIVVATRGRLTETSRIVRIPLGFVTGFTFLAAANAVNDYYDRSIDAVNEPNRPIPSGAVHPNEALACAAVLSVIGFMAAAFTNVSSLIVALVAWLLFTYYATKGKRTGLLGNLIVSACVAIPFIYGGFVVEKEFTSLMVIFAFMAFMSTAGREITKGIVDAEGDRIQGAKTLAVLYGASTAAVSAGFFYVFAVALSVLPWLLNEVSVWYVPFVVVADAGFLSSSLSLLHNHSRENARRVKNLARVWMVIGLLAFILGAFEARLIT